MVLHHSVSAVMAPLGIYSNNKSLGISCLQLRSQRRDWNPMCDAFDKDGLFLPTLPLTNLRDLYLFQLEVVCLQVFMAL